MRAAVLKGVGGPEQLVVDEVPEPEVAEGQAVVDVRAVGEIGRASCRERV